MANKHFSVPLTELKASDSDRTFEGYGAIFGNVDLGGDIVMRGAFSKSLAEHQRNDSLPLLFWMHDPTKVPGKWLEMREERDGLYVKGVLARTTLGDEVRELLRLKAVAGLSIGYSTVQGEYNRDGHRQLTELKLHEVSVVSMPMNPRAQVSSAKLAETLTSVRDFEAVLRHAFGFSGRQAKRLATRTWDEFSQTIHGAGADELESISTQLEDATAIASLLAAAERIRRI